MGLATLLVGVNLVVHESGHFLAARRMGLRVMQWRLGPFEFIARHSGFRARWHRAVKGTPAGFVHAVPSPQAPMRRAYLVTVAAGPLADLAAAAVAGMAGLLLPGTAAAPVFAFALISLSSVLINLFPSPRESNDGALLLFWWRLRDEHVPVLAGVRLMALSVDGTTADRLPADELRTLETTEPWSAAWYRAKAAQLRGDWTAARQEWQWLVDWFDRFTPEQRRGLRDFRHQVLAEQAFTTALATRDPAPLRAPYLLPADVAWRLPSLQARCAALQAALDGDAPACARGLDLAQRHAEDDVDRALASAETRLAIAVRDVARVAGAAAVPA
nr:site-2 protease family protein [Tahibacter caeni]